MEITSEMVAAIIGACIGLVGTIFGTLLSWFLVQFSNKGKLYISTVDWKVKFETRDGLGGEIECEFENSDSFLLKVKLDIYNSSTQTKIMRNIEIVFFDKSGILLKAIVPNDDDLTFKDRIYTYFKVGSWNISAKTVVTKKLVWYLWKQECSFDFIANTESVYLKYIDEKGRTKKTLLKRGNVRDY